MKTTPAAAGVFPVPPGGRAAAACLLALAALAGRGPSPARGVEVESSVVARVGADSITTEQVVAQARRNPATVNEDPVAYRHRLLEPLIDRLLLEAEAERHGLVDDPQVLAELRRAEDEELGRRIQQLEMEAQPEVSDAEVEAELGRRRDEEPDLTAAQVRAELRGRRRSEARRRFERQAAEAAELALEATAIARLAAAITPYDTQDPQAFGTALVEPGAIDSSLVLYRTSAGPYTVADFMAGPGARRTMYTATWVGDAERLTRDLVRTAARQGAAALARDRGLDATPDFQRWSARHHERLAVTRLYELEVAANSHPSAGELRAYYEAHRDRYRTTELLDTQSWSLTDSTIARRVERALRQGLPAAMATALARDSQTLLAVQKLSQPRSSFEEQIGHPAAVGDIICLVGPTTSWVHQVLGLQPSTVRPYETVAEEVRREVEGQRAEERLKELLDESRARVGVTVDDQALARVPV